MPTPPSATLELGHVQDGYPTLAEWITHDPDKETLVFRKFDKLAARNLLHLQARLIAVEQELDQLDYDARKFGDENARRASGRWKTLMEHAGGSEKERVDKLNDLNHMLKEYHDTLLLQAKIAQMKKPDSRPLAAIRDFVRGGASVSRLGANRNPTAASIITGRASAFLDDDADLVALGPPTTEEDYLSRFLRNNWLFRKRRTSDPFDRTTIHHNSHVVRTVATLSLALAAILLVGAIVTLYLVPGPKVRLGLIAMYTMLFASSVALRTNARRTEVFAATAAYAAVLVVFVASGRPSDVQTEQDYSSVNAQHA